MPVILSSVPGRVVALDLPNDAPLPMAITGWGGADVLKSIITEVAIGQSDKFQAVQTLDELIYIYSMGRDPGKMRIGGVAFQGGCGGSGSTGIEALQDYYDQYSVSASPEPLTVVLGSSAASTHTAFLVGLETQILRPEARLAQFGLQLMVMPRRRSST